MFYCRSFLAYSDKQVIPMLAAIGELLILITIYFGDFPHASAAMCEKLPENGRFTCSGLFADATIASKLKHF